MGTMETLQDRRLSAAALAVLAAVWVCILVVPPAILLGYRTAWLAALEQPEAQTQWDEFRDAMREQTGRKGPVQRKVPKSQEPPLRVWLRDYVWLAIAAWIVLGGVLGLFTGFLALGAATTGAAPRSPAEDQPRRHGDHEEQHQGDAQNAENRRHEN